MDEPFSAVDPVVRKDLQTELLRLQSELSKTILFVTHDIDEAIQLGDKVAVLNTGGVLEQFDTPPNCWRTRRTRSSRASWAWTAACAGCPSSPPPASRCAPSPW